MNLKTKAIFLDRDGVINFEVGDYIMRLEDFKILPHIIPGLKSLQELGYLLIVITNQGGIAKGLYTHETFRDIHKFLNMELEKNQIQITEVYYCPHHPSSSECLCRKPGSLLVEKAIAKYDIDPSLSWFIGDKQRDIDAGAAAGVKGILIEPNEDWTSHIHQFNTSAVKEVSCVTKN